MDEKKAEEGQTARPPSVFSLAAAGGGGGLGALLGGAKKLSSRSATRLAFVKKPLDEGELQAQWKLSSTDRMRMLDDLHKHAPLPDECTALGIPDDRLDLHRTHDVLFLSGGCCGVRFSSDELTTFARLRGELVPLYESVHNHFLGMSSLQRKKILAGGPYTAADAPEIAAFPTDAEEGAKETIAFHLLADLYSRAMREMQTLIKSKQDSIKRDGTHLKFDADPESLVGQPMPLWLSTLLRKYQREINPPAPASSLAEEGAILSTARAASSAGITRAESSALKKGVTIGKLAAFLSCCIVNTLPCSEEEWAAVAQLLHASNDTQAFFSIDGKLHEVVPGGAPRSQKYWAERVFKFLASVSELKTVPKDEKSVDAFDEFM